MLTTRLSSNLYRPTQPYPTFAQNPNFVEPDYPTKCVAVLFTPDRKPMAESRWPNAKLLSPLVPTKTGTFTPL